MKHPGLLSFSALSQFVGGQVGVHDVPCPVCGPDRCSTINRRRKVLRVWRPTSSFASYHCARCGLDGHARQHGTPAPEPAALARARASAAQFAAATAEARCEKARWLWRRRQPIEGSVAEKYLRECRRYAGKLPATLGFLPARNDFAPAMIAAFGIPDEVEPNVLSISAAGVMGVHLTRLKTDGSGKAGIEKDKIMIGAPSGAPLVLAAAGDMAGMAITEGIEDALSVHEATGLGAWAAGSASLLSALTPVVPDWMQCVTIVGDDDAAGRKYSQELANSLEARGFEVRLVVLTNERAA
jgi:Toprim domain